MSQAEPKAGTRQKRVEIWPLEPRWGDGEVRGPGGSDLDSGRTSLMQGSSQRLKMEPEQEMVVGKWDLGVGIIWRRQNSL